MVYGPERICDLWPKTAIFVVMKKAIFGYFFNIVSLIELNPSPELCIEILRPVEKDLAQLDLLY